MIEVQGISKRYGAIEALRGVSLSVPKGQIVGFLGANGAGKTTTMDILCGCIGADTGRAQIAGYDITDQPKEAKRRLGYLPDEPPLHSDMRVAHFIEYAAHLRGIKGAEARSRVAATMDRLAITDVKDRLVGNLSKGYRQRVGLAQALVHSPDVLVLDEPTEGLDPNQIVQIRELIRSLKGEHTIILSSHILSEVQNTCDEIVIIDRGQIVAKGPYEKLVQDLAHGSRFELRVGERSNELLQRLQDLAIVKDIELLNPARHIIGFSVEGREGVIDQVARTALDGGFGLRELASHSKSLEDVFFQLTQNH